MSQKKGKKKTNKKKTNAVQTASSLVAVAKIPVAKTPVPKPDKNLVERICGLVDPFCPKAKGAKWEDGYGESTMCAQLRGHTTYSSLSNGGNLIYYQAAMSFPIMTMSSVTAGVYTSSSSYTPLPGYLAAASYMAAYRIVTAGLIIRNVCPALTAGGFIVITRQAVMASGVTAYSAGNVYGVETATHSICAGMEVPVIFRELGTSSRSFQAANTSGTAPPGGWDVITIEIVGAPASTVMLDIENVYNIEFTLTPANVGLQQFLPVSAPSNPVVSNLANHASQELSTLMWTGVERLGKAAITAIATKLGGPKAGQKVYQLTNAREVD